jgi:hypothetical protein
LRIIGEEMRGRPLGKLAYYVLGSMDTWSISGRENVLVPVRVIVDVGVLFWVSLGPV